MFHFALYNTPLSLSLSSDIIETIFAEASIRNPLDQNGTINIVFAWDDEIRSLNSQYRQKDSTTDILSFHYFDDFSRVSDDEIVGEILLSESKILAQAIEFDHTPEAETYRLIAHGVLHIIGYDHESDEEYAVMHPREIELTNAIRSKHHLKIVD